MHGNYSAGKIQRSIRLFVCLPLSVALKKRRVQLLQSKFPADGEIYNCANVILLKSVDFSYLSMFASERRLRHPAARSPQIASERKRESARNKYVTK